MSLPRNFCLSFASAELTPTTSLTIFTDHYAVLNLDNWATTEEIKAEFRKLRAAYFATDASKYRQLQTAYAVLVDWEARREYDAVYRVRKGLPPLAQVGGTISSSSIGSEIVHTRSNSFSSSVSPPRKTSLVRAAVSRIDAQHVQSLVQLQEDKHCAEVVKIEDERRHEEEEQHHREDDPNWGLKHFDPQCKPLIGSQPYHSYIPVPVAYWHDGNKPRFRRPTYIRDIAAKALP